MTNKEMIESIKSMGFNGKITTLPVERVAKCALKALKKKKAVVIPGIMNKIIYFFSKFCSPYFLAKTTGMCIWLAAANANAMPDASTVKIFVTLLSA